MAYEKQNFNDGDILAAAQLNHIEDGIAENAEAIGDIGTALDEIIAVQETLIGGDSE